MDKAQETTKAPTKEDKPLPMPNISCLSGIRSLCCLWILLYHAAAFTSVLPLSHPSMKRIRDTPILGFFANSTLAVDVFWILSGFLCEYQLNYKVDTTKPRWYFWFMVNRLLRLGPLFLINVLLAFASPVFDTCSTVAHLFRSIFFMDVFGPRSKDGLLTGCSGTGWTANVDVHGYLAILALFIFVRDQNTKKYVLYGLFLLSCIVTLYKTISASLSWPVMTLGLEAFSPEVDETAVEMGFPDPFSFFPEFDAMKPEFVAYRQRSGEFTGQLYFSSISRHGASMFLGSIMAIHLMNRVQKIDSTRSYTTNLRLMLTDGLRLLVGLIAGYFVVDLRLDLSARSALWTAAYQKLAAVALFCLLESLLVLYQYDNVISDVIRRLLANRTWSFFAKFTYGIYLFHAIPLVMLVYTPFPLDVEKGGIGADGYGWCYLLKLTGATLVIVGIFSFVLHYLVEYPAQWFRYKYVRNRYSKSRKRKKV